MRNRRRKPVGSVHHHQWGPETGPWTCLRCGEVFHGRSADLPKVRCRGLVSRDVRLVWDLLNPMPDAPAPVSPSRISAWFQSPGRVPCRIDYLDKEEMVAAVYADGWIAFGDAEHLAGPETGEPGQRCADAALVLMGVLDAVQPLPAAPAVGPLESGAILEWLRSVGHTEACGANLIGAGGSYPGCDDPGVCWCGLPEGWRTPNAQEAT